MDIEGSELKALIGARNTIVKYHPKLFICIYHKAADPYEIVNYIREMSTEYKLFLRCHHVNGAEVVLYAI